MSRSLGRTRGIYHTVEETILVMDRSYQPRLISILGGKLTAYRITAQKTMHQAAARLPLRKALADTADLLLV